MKRQFLLCLAITLASMSVWAQVQFADPYLTDETRPDAVSWLPEPPVAMSGEFYNDFYFYEWGKSQRETRGEQALWDESAGLYEVFSESMGIELSPELTPEIWTLASGATSDAMAAKKKTKSYYQRRRPFATFAEPSLKPEEDEVEATSASYPSGHAVAGWMFALTLCTVAPEHTGAIMDRAAEYALNRVICGHHWKSDIDAGLMLSVGIFTNVVATEAYQQQLVKAREEYQRLKEGTGIAPKRSTTADSPAYRLNGMPAVKDARGIIVTQGRVILR